MNKNIIKIIAYYFATMFFVASAYIYDNNKKITYNFSVSGQTLSYATVALLQYNTERKAYTPYCAGVWLDDYHIITAYHCASVQENGDNYADSIIGNRISYISALDAFRNGVIATEFKTRRAAVVISADQNIDLALIKILGKASYHININSYRGQPRIGDKIHVIGHTAGMTYSYTKGHIASIRLAQPYYANRKIKLLQIDASIYRGNSGGGVFDDRGNLLGISSFLLLESNVAFFIHRDEIINFLNKSKILY